MKLLNKTPKEIYNHCKQVVLEKSKHTKLEIQKAQQFIDEFLKIKKIKKGEQLIFDTLEDLQSFSEKYKPKDGEYKVECKKFFVLTKN